MAKRRRIDSPKMSNEEIRKKFDETPLEKGDMVAMMMAGLGVILPMVLIVCGVFVAIIWLLFLS